MPLSVHGCRISSLSTFDREGLLTSDFAKENEFKEMEWEKKKNNAKWSKRKGGGKGGKYTSSQRL